MKKIQKRFLFSSLIVAPILIGTPILTACSQPEVSSDGSINNGDGPITPSPQPQQPPLNNDKVEWERIVSQGGTSGTELKYNKCLPIFENFQYGIPSWSVNDITNKKFNEAFADTASSDYQNLKIEILDSSSYRDGILRFNISGSYKTYEIKEPVEVEVTGFKQHKQNFSLNPNGIELNKTKLLEERITPTSAVDWNVEKFRGYCSRINGSLDTKDILDSISAIEFEKDDNNSNFIIIKRMEVNSDFTYDSNNDVWTPISASVDLDKTNNQVSFLEKREVLDYIANNKMFKIEQINNKTASELKDSIFQGPTQIRIVPADQEKENILTKYKKAYFADASDGFEPYIDKNQKNNKEMFTVNDWEGLLTNIPWNLRLGNTTVSAGNSLTISCFKIANEYLKCDKNKSTLEKTLTTWDKIRREIIKIEGISEELKKLNESNPTYPIKNNKIFDNNTTLVNNIFGNNKILNDSELVLYDNKDNVINNFYTQIGWKNFQLLGNLFDRQKKFNGEILIPNGESSISFNISKISMQTDQEWNQTITKTGDTYEYLLKFILKVNLGDVSNEINCSISATFNNSDLNIL